MKSYIPPLQQYIIQPLKNKQPRFERRTTLSTSPGVFPRPVASALRDAPGAARAATREFPDRFSDFSDLHVSLGKADERRGFANSMCLC